MKKRKQRLSLISSLHYLKLLFRSILFVAATIMYIVGEFRNSHETLQGFEKGYWLLCDMICILFLCPFQTWIMKNRCCTVCRIYNWDFAMMFTPYIFIPNGYAWSLLAMSIILLIRWEIAVRKYPERFSDRTNACVSCENCEEKLCHHKKQLWNFLKKRIDV